jgi:callose synthase
MQQIYKFEAKLAQGNAEQCLSRDVDRMANRLDFPRLLSYFFGGIGHYINSTLTVFTIITVTYIIALTALFGYERVGDQVMVVLGSVQVLLAGMGVLQTLPLMATLTVERGLGGALMELLRVFGSGGPFYFIFHIQTRAYYFFQTLVAGGAQYRATGDGGRQCVFVVRVCVCFVSLFLCWCVSSQRRRQLFVNTLPPSTQHPLRPWVCDPPRAL